VKSPELCAVDFFGDAATELSTAMKAYYSPFASAHEGYAVIAEEVDELWEHVRFPYKQRNAESMRRECIQIAAMAARFAIELCETGRVNER